MSNTASKRILRDLLKIEADKTTKESMNIIILSQEDLFRLKFSFKGPSGTPYEGGTFNVSMRIPQNYPYQPPKVFFSTKVWHPNICSESGLVCLNVLKNDWRSVLTLQVVLISLHELLTCPNPADPQDRTAGRQCLLKPEIFKNTAIMWTHVYANGPNSVSELVSKIDQLADMGLGNSREARLITLSGKDWDLQKAVDRFLGIPDDNDDDIPILNLGPEYDRFLGLTPQ